MGAVVTQSAATRYMQGIAVPAESVDPTQFFHKTRRHISTEKTLSYGGGGTSQTVELRKADILSSLLVRFVGSLVVTPGGGTVASTAAWPYGIAGFAFTANGQSNLINTGPGGGIHLKARDYMKRTDLNDRGVSQTVAGASKTQGTLSLATESWGVGSQTSTIGAGTYNVDITIPIPIAEDEKDLLGAIFLQTSSSDLTLRIDEYPLSTTGTSGALFALTGAATVALTGTWQVESTKFSIPIGASGQIVVPDLSVFHSIIGSRTAAGIATGENEQRVIGQGAGKSLLRIYGRYLNGSGQAPLPINATNFGPMSYRFGNNEQPDTFLDGGHHRADMERRYNSDLCSIWGYFCHDFASENAFRDVLDMGTTAELRFSNFINSAVSLSNAALEYVQETVFLAGQAA